MIRYFIIACILVCLFSCDKNDSVDLKVDQTSTVKSIIEKPSEQMLVFDTQEELEQAYKSTFLKTIEEREEWEKTQGFVSLGTYGDKRYEEIDPDEFTSVEEVKAFVDENSDVFQLIEDENGELTLETILFSSAEKYLLNKDGMYQVKDSVYKVFREGLASADLNNLSNLKNATADNIESLVKTTPTIKYTKFIKQNETVGLKSTYCESHKFDEKVTGNNKLWYEFDLRWVHLTSPTRTRVWSYLFMRPYKKTSGIWFICTRTISCNFKQTYSWYLKYGGFGSYSDQFLVDNKTTSNYQGTTDSHLITADYKATGLCYYKQDFWMDTPSIDEYTYYCIGRKYN